MNQRSDIKFEKLLGKKTLIVGEIGSGKTTLLGNFLDYLVENGLAGAVTLIEMAPGYGEIGRRVEEYTDKVNDIRYLRPRKIFPPRLLGRSIEEILDYAKRNYQELKELFMEFEKNPTEILLINDLTIFLHAGAPEEVIALMGPCKTFAATAYEGAKLADDKGSGITFRERKALSVLKKHVDQVIHLTKA